MVLESRQQAELPPLVADLPVAARRGPVLAGWLRGTWSRVTGHAAHAAGGPRRQARRAAQAQDRDPAAPRPAGR